MFSSPPSAVHLIWMMLLLSLSISQYNGFKTYYMDRMCGSTISMAHGDLFSGQIKFAFDIQPTDCILYIKAGIYGYNRVNFYFSDVDLRDGCGGNTTTLVVSQTDDTMEPMDIPGFPGHLSGIPDDIVGQAFMTTSPCLVLRFHTSCRDHNARFNLMFDKYSNEVQRPACASYEYTCDNRRCISKKQTCNHENPCGDNSDCKYSGLSKGQITGIVIGVTAFVAIVAFLYFALPKIVKARVERRDDRRMEEFHQRQRELDTAFPNLTGGGGHMAATNNTRVESTRSNGHTSDTRTSSNRSDLDDIELQVRLPETRTNRRNGPAQRSNLPPSYESLDQIPSIPGAQTIPGLHAAAKNTRNAQDTRSSNGRGVDIPSSYNSREHLIADDIRQPMSDGAGSGRNTEHGAAVDASSGGQDDDTEPSPVTSGYLAPPPSYATAITHSDVYMVTSPSGSAV